MAANTAPSYHQCTSDTDPAQPPPTRDHFATSAKPIPHFLFVCGLDIEEKLQLTATGIENPTTTI